MRMYDRMTGTIRLAAALLLIGVAATARAGDEETGGQLLRYRYTAGQVREYTSDSRFDTTTNVTMPMGQMSQDMEVKGAMEIQEKTVSLADGGGATLECRFPAFDVTGNGTMTMAGMGETPMEFRMTPDQMSVKIAGQEMPMPMGDTNPMQVLKETGLTTAVTARGERGAASFDAATFTPQLKQFMQTFENALQSPLVLPEQAVAVGATWESSLTQSLTSVPATSIVKYIFAGMEAQGQYGNCAKIEFQTTVAKADVDEKKLGELMNGIMPGMTLTVTDIDAAVKGVIWFSVNEGCIVKAETDIKATYSMATPADAAGNGMAMDIKTVVEGRDVMTIKDLAK